MVYWCKKVLSRENINGYWEEILIMYQKWEDVFYQMLKPSVGSRRGIIPKLHYKKLSNIYRTSQEGCVLLELKNNLERWTHLAWKKFDNNYEFDKDGEKDLLATLYTNSRFYLIIGGCPKKVWLNIISCV